MADLIRKKLSIWDPSIIRQAILDSFRKLDPRIQVKNPVMFIVEIGSVITTIAFVHDLRAGTGALFVPVRFASSAGAGVGAHRRRGVQHAGGSAVASRPDGPVWDREHRVHAATALSHPALLD